jgi:hypothetical protein
MPPVGLYGISKGDALFWMFVSKRFSQPKAPELNSKILLIIRNGQYLGCSVMLRLSKQYQGTEAQSLVQTHSNVDPGNVNPLHAYRSDQKRDHRCNRAKMTWLNSSLPTIETHIGSNQGVA